MSSDEDRDKQLDEEDLLLFRRAMKNIKPLTKPQQRVLLKQKRAVRKNIPIPGTEDYIYLSDHSNEETVAQEQLISFARPGISTRQIKRLKQGKFPISAKLDLHGSNLNSAKDALSTFLISAYKKNQRSLLIIHGKGHSDQPLLKNKINQWLRQIEIVLAFSSTLPKHGGAGAVYVLLKSK